MKIQDFFSSEVKLHTPVLTIGMFDGVHRGHQTLFSHLKNCAQQLHGETVAVTFAEHPRKVLRPPAPPLIMPLEKKLAILSQMGLDVCLLLDFNREVASISAENFIEKYLVGVFHMAGIVVGKNFHFGHQGKGNSEMLRKYAALYRYQVQEIDLIQNGMEEISSTTIRKAVSHADLHQAHAMLGRPFSLIGKVVVGKQRGRLIGFPTANLALSHDLVPPEGVYCGYSVVEEKTYPALISIGTCPTFHEHELKIEVYLVGFSGNLYGRTLETFLWGKIRDQKTYSSVEELCREIEKDREYLLQYFEKQSGRAVLVG